LAPVDEFFLLERYQELLGLIQSNIVAGGSGNRFSPVVKLAADVGDVVCTGQAFDIGSNSHLGKLFQICGKLRNFTRASLGANVFDPPVADFQLARNSVARGTHDVQVLASACIDSRELYLQSELLEDFVGDLLGLSCELEVTVRINVSFRIDA